VCGAGNVFRGAFCYADFEQMTIAEALAFSNAMAAPNRTAFAARIAARTDRKPGAR